MDNSQKTWSKAQRTAEFQKAFLNLLSVYRLSDFQARVAVVGIQDTAKVSERDTCNDSVV